MEPLTLPDSSWVSRAKKDIVSLSAPGQVSKIFAPPMRCGYIARGCLAFGGPLSGAIMSIGFQNAATTPSAAHITVGRKLLLAPSNASASAEQRPLSPPAKQKRAGFSRISAGVAHRLKSPTSSASSS